MDETEGKSTLKILMCLFSIGVHQHGQLESDNETNTVHFISSFNDYDNQLLVSL